MVRAESARGADSRQFPGQNLLDFSGSKRPLFARGKRGNRRSGQFSPSSQFEDDGEVEESGRRSSVLRKGKKVADQTEDSPSSLKLRISSPFDFQHVSHADRRHITSLDATPEQNGTTEHRGALKGIRADGLHFDNLSSDSLAAPESRAASVMGFRSQAMSPSFAPEHDVSSATLRTARSVESFSQPGILPRAHRHTRSATPSSRPFSPIDDALETDLSGRRVAASPHSNRNSGVWDKFVPLVSPFLDNKLPTIADESDNFGHAITTPDDSAIHAITPIYSPGLEDVAEEPERFSSPRPAPSPPMRSPRPPRSPFFDSISSRSAQRTPISRTNSRSGSATSSKPTTQRAPITRPISQMSDTLGSSTPAKRNSLRRPSTTRRKSNTWRVIEESWEDDVDFIYENALEADCEFDWENGSDGARTPEDRERTPQQQDGQQNGQEPTSASNHSRTISMQSEEEFVDNSTFYPGNFRPSLLVPSTISVPELEYRSALSASTADTGMHTPSDLFSSMDRRQAPYSESEGFVLTPSMLIPPEYKEQPRDEMYNDLLANYEGSDRHFPILDARKSIASSSRSSHIRSSKRSSYDSSLMSSGIWSTPVRRSASSSGSLPELVHSRRSRKDINAAVEQLSQQVAAVTTGGNSMTETEDDDVTPPGRQCQDRTFFASEDEEEAQSSQFAIESEVRASLDLAQQGSSRSSRQQPHGHKYASSDGAAKLLASPMMRTPELQQAPKGRARAASSAARNSRPYLSLFPTPPKTTPLATPTSPNPAK
ncbi:uncharacterized protein EI97DRAFT_460782 [Westerdykella ornata]|uniref:CRIB domain-containing protein n=1 Tax=Westerdykella ornata TaxID=318751 RepID=A0A6A6JBP3_WESOR|nr:uncharacterized protein EI97DRAFT_460782 [Westerdykella ornata]KAF2273852.1 hypothetical protein EI97DRAFT_460782 [Westerdykella ornata]